MVRGCTTADENNPDPSEQPTLRGRDARATKAHFQERHGGHRGTRSTRATNGPRVPPWPPCLRGETDWVNAESIGLDKRTEAVFLQLLLHRIRLPPGFKSANFQKVEIPVGAGWLNDVIITLRLEDRSLRFYLPFVFESPDLNGIPARVGRLG